MYVCMYVYINEQTCSTVLVLSRACCCWIKNFDVDGDVWFDIRAVVVGFGFVRTKFTGTYYRVLL